MMICQFLKKFQIFRQMIIKVIKTISMMTNIKKTIMKIEKITLIMNIRREIWIFRVNLWMMIYQFLKEFQIYLQMIIKINLTVLMMINIMKTIMKIQKIIIFKIEIMTFKLMVWMIICQFPKEFQTNL